MSNRRTVDTQDPRLRRCVVEAGSLKTSRARVEGKRELAEDTTQALQVGKQSENIRCEISLTWHPDRFLVSHRIVPCYRPQNALVGGR